MHLHFPKPMHGWREFIGEVGVIVLGVLIALLAENLAEGWHWHEERMHASLAIEAEVKDAAGVAYERLILQPCLKHELETMANFLIDNPSAPQGIPSARVFSGDALPSFYRPPSRTIAENAWSNVTETPLLSHMEQEDIDRFSGIYRQIRVVNDLERDERHVAPLLAPFVFSPQLNQQNRLQLLQALAEADRINSDLASVSSTLISEIRSVRLPFNRQEIDDLKSRHFLAAREIYGSCVVDQPLDIGQN